MRDIKPAERSAVQEPYPKPLYAWSVVILLLLIYTHSFIDRQIMALLAAPIQADLGVSDAGFGLLTGTAFGLFYTFFGIPLARVADRASRTKLIAAGITLWSLMTTACGLARGFPALFLARLGVGVGEAALTPAANSMIADYFPPHRRARAVAVYTLGIPIGSALAFLFGAVVIGFATSLGEAPLPLVGQVRGWQITFFLVGLPGLVFALLMLFVREPLRRGLAMAPGQRVSLVRTLGYFASQWRIYVLSFLGISLQSAIGYSTAYFIILFMGRMWDIPAAQAGFIFGMTLLTAGVGGMLLAGWLTDRWVGQGKFDAHVRMILISSAGILPFLLIFPLMPTAAAGVPFLVGAIFFSNMLWGTAYAGVAGVSPNEMRGQSTAVYLFIVNLFGLVVAPPVFGLLSDSFGIDKAFMILGIVACPLSIVLLLAARPAFARQFAAINGQAV